MKIRVWNKEEIRNSFEEYILEIHLVETDAWKQLSVDDWNTLIDRHFEIFFRELERFAPKRKMKI